MNSELVEIGREKLSIKIRTIIDTTFIALRTLPPQRVLHEEEINNTEVRGSF
ncbi:hypothetical protein [Oceanobacillus halophilus]|uniref:hypothetical protein n=1 Tax=Oceanobacillus halophilus TaxID=930130 RepID=UPI001313EB2E|nr:hypothetical protein [Oceanobacillus halophilus]